MTITELAGITNSPLEIRSGYNGKVLCRQYVEKKHEHLSQREVISIWGEIRATNGSGYSSFAHPVICVHVHGREEHEQEHQKEATP